MLRPSTAAIAIDGVLRKPGLNTPIREGIKLYLTLAATYDIVLVSDQEQDDSLQYWLSLNGVNKHVGRILWSDRGGRLDQLRSLRRTGGLVDLVVEPDPACAAELYQDGFTVLVFLSPQYARPEWRPDAEDGIPSWEDLMERVKDDHGMYDGDERLGETNA
jgi:hypothetical protein